MRSILLPNGCRGVSRGYQIGRLVRPEPPPSREAEFAGQLARSRALAGTIPHHAAAARIWLHKWYRATAS